MHTFCFSRAPAALLFATATFVGSSQAANFTLSGTIVNHNDIVQIDFSLAGNATNVKLWTDSFLSGTNFDPTGALWVKRGSNFDLLSEVDDNDTVGPNQGFFDTGFSLPTLAAGQYRLTLGAAPNFAKGTLLSQGFAFSNQTPIPLSQWIQPGSDPNGSDQKGGFWRVSLSGVDQAAVVPEPASILLMALGVVALLARSRLSRA
jgi:PEP-CTERM motif